MSREVAGAVDDAELVGNLGDAEIVNRDDSYVEPEDDQPSEAEAELRKAFEGANSDEEEANPVDNGEGDAEEDDQPEQSVEEGDQTAEDDTETEGDAEEIPPGPKELRDRYKQLKQERKERDERIAALERENQEYRKIQQQREAQKAAQPPDPIDQLAAKYQTDDLIGLIGRIEKGQEEGTEEQLAQLRAKAFEILERKPATELREAIRKARNGGYGESSREAEYAAQDAMMQAMAFADERGQQQQQKAKWDQDRASAWERVKEAAGFQPDASGNVDLSSENAKDWAAAAEELATLLPNIGENANAPEVAMNYAQLKRDAALGKQVPELQAKIDALESQIGKLTGTPPKGQPTTPVTPEKQSAEDELRAAFAGAGYQV